MPISLRNRRATVYDYVDAGSAGEPDSTYELVTSGDSDDAWWASKANPTGHETTTGMQADHRVDAVFGFAANAPVTEDGAIVCESVEYLVRAVLPRDYGRDEVQVYAERATADLSLFEYTTMEADVEEVSTTGAEGGTVPDDEVIAVTRTGTGSVELAGPVAAIAYDGDSDGWLAAVVTGSDPTFTLTLSFDQTGLLADTYTATVTVTDANAPHSTITITVELVVT